MILMLMATWAIYLAGKYNGQVRGSPLEQRPVDNASEHGRNPTL